MLSLITNLILSKRKIRVILFKVMPSEQTGTLYDVKVIKDEGWSVIA
jgi:hypothetical protein